MKTPTINSRIVKLEVLKGTATRTSVNAVESRTTSLESDVATLTQGIASAVSTHNTAPDSHADLRTLVAGKQDSLTISTVGEAMLAIATPSGQKIPRVNADGSVVLINVPSGDGVGGSSWYASDDGPPGVYISLSWVSNGDTNGVFRALGAESGRWSNPASSGRIRSLASSIYAGADAVELLTDRNTTNTTTNNVANSWFAFDLGVGTTLALDSYSLQGRGKDSNNQLRTWAIHGSNDVSEWTAAGVAAASWTTLDSRTSDTTISGAGVWGHWACAARSAPFRFIRIVQTGPNSSGELYLSLSEVELYGLVFAPAAKPVGATGWARNSELIDDATAWMPYYATSALTDGTPIFGTAYDVAYAVSTHNTAPDSHADLRTLVAGRALIGHQHARADMPWVTEPGAALLTAASASAQRTALGMTAWAVAPWTDGTTSDIPEGTQLYFTNARADARAALIVSAHNVAGDSHTDIRTALAGKQAAGSYLTTTGTAADSAKLGGVAASGYSQTSHTHNYAGSSTPGGAATTALACTGNAATATTAASCTGNSATATTASSCSGNAATATKLATARTLTIGSKANTFDGSADKAWTLAEIGAASTTALTTEATTRASSDNALWAALYAEQTGGTTCEIPLASTGDGSGVLTLRLWSDVANTATISAGAFYGEIGGTTNLGQSVSMAAGQYTTFYIKLPASATATITITYGWALTKWGQSGTECIFEATNAPKLNGFNIKYIPQNVTTIRLNSNLGTSIVTGSTRAWIAATYIFFSGGSITLSGTTYPWTSATYILFQGNSITLSGTTYPWTSATQIYFQGNSITLSGTTYPWTSATQIYFYGSSMTLSGTTYTWTSATSILFYGNSMTLTANLSTSCLTTGSLYLYLLGTGIAVTYTTTRLWPTTMRQVFLRPSVGSMPTADTDRLFIDVDATCTTASNEKVLDARGNCGAVTAASSAARASLVAKGFAVSYNS